MPSIPRYQRSVGIPGVSGGVVSRGGTTPDLSPLGEALGKAADVIAKRQEELRKQDMVNKAIIIDTAYNDEQRSFLSSETQKTGQDTFDNLARAEEFRKSSLEKYTADIKDQELKNAVTTRILSSSEGMLNKLSLHQASQRKEVTQAATSNLLASVSKDAYAGGDLTESMARFSTAIQAQRAAGALGEEEAIEAITKGEQALAEAHLDGLINRDPVSGLEAIKNGTYSDVLPQKKIEEYDKNAKVLRNDIERQQKEALKKSQEAVEQQIINGFVSGKPPSPKQINDSNLSPEDKYKWIKRREDFAKKGESSDNKRVQTGLVLDVHSVGEMMNGKELTRDEVYGRIKNAALNGDITPATAGALLTTLESKTKPQKAPKDVVRDNQMSQAMGLLQRMDKEGMFDEDDPTNDAVLFAKATDDLQKWSESNPDGNPIEYVEKNVLPQKKASWWSKLLSGPKVDNLAIKNPIADIRARNEAIQALKDRGRAVTEETIQKTMEHLKNAK